MVDWASVVISIIEKTFDFAVQHPFISIIALISGYVILMLLSHVADIKEGIFRNGVLWFFFILLIGVIIAIVLSAVDAGTLDLAPLIQWLKGGDA